MSLPNGLAHGRVTTNDGPHRHRSIECHGIQLVYCRRDREFVIGWIESKMADPITSFILLVKSQEFWGPNIGRRNGL